MNILAICHRNRVYPVAKNPTLQDAIRAFEDKIKQHHRSPAQSCCRESGDRLEWDQINDALHENLAALKEKEVQLLQANYKPQPTIPQPLPDPPTARPTPAQKPPTGRPLPAQKVGRDVPGAPPSATEPSTNPSARNVPTASNPETKPTTSQGNEAPTNPAPQTLVAPGTATPPPAENAPNALPNNKSSIINHQSSISPTPFPFPDPQSTPSAVPHSEICNLQSAICIQKPQLRNPQ